MPQFTKRSTSPMSPESYRRAVREIRRYADHIEAAAAAETAPDKRRLSIAISGLSRYTRLLFRRHAGLPLEGPRE